MTRSRPSSFRKCCATILAAALTLQPMGIYAAPITNSFLAEAPLQGTNLAKPNIMFTMDDSLSMAQSILPDYIGALFACRNPDASAAQCLADLSPAHPAWRSKDVNHIYYDPAATYDVGVAFDKSLLPYRSGTGWTSVYTDGFAAYLGTNTGTIDLTASYPDEVFCWKATTNPADLATATTDGSVCRFNGVAYGSENVGGITTPAVTAGYNYPNAATSTCANTATSACVFGTRQLVTGKPYYYTIENVKFCPTQDAKGWGVLSSACSTRFSDTSRRFVSYGSGGFDPSAFKRVTIDTGNAAQMDNFAKWYAFNRTRILAMRTAGGIAFARLDEKSRVGFNTFTTYPDNFLNVVDFTPANKNTWFRNFYSAQLSDGKAFVGNTPTFDAMWRIGQYFANLPTALPPDGLRPALPGLPGAVDPLDPVTGKCQANYHLLATDGYQNQFRGKSYPGVGADTIGNEDNIVPNLPNLPGTTGFKPGDPFPSPYREGLVATLRTLADVAMYYWIHDLRPALEDLNGVWQRVVFYPLSLGAEGTLDSFPTNGTWPTPAFIPLGGTDLVAPNPTSIDDLWHAAQNGGGTYSNAQTPRELAEGILKALLAATTPASGTSTAIGLTSAQLNSADTSVGLFGYLTASPDSNWSGDVLKFELDRNTGLLKLDPVTNKPAVIWSASSQLDAQANRRIVTINESGAGVPFALGNLSSFQTEFLTKGWSDAGVTPVPSAQSVVDFLRGDKSNEGPKSTNFRVRAHALGDIVASAAVPVGEPNQIYDDAGNPGYVAFKATNKTRTPAVYVGANDGMLHALDDSSSADAGKETWAYVPRALFSGADPNDSTHTPSPDYSIGALTFRVGGLPPFAHRFYVNATPRIWDINFNNTNTDTPPTDTSGAGWHTMLVGGLGAGGRAVYALDVTTPVSSADSESAAASHVLWEFTDADLGHVFDAPTLVKTYAYGWVVLVASGYNNPGGKGILYVLNPTDGTILQKLSTPVGSDADPSGLSTIRAYTASRKDPYVLQAYGGDLKGNVWRFDLSNSDASKWKVELIANLTGPDGPQPITTGIRIEVDQSPNVDRRYLFVGTGRLLSETDLSDTSVNTLYVISDGTRATPDPAPGTPYSRSVLNTVDIGSPSGFSVVVPGSRGWYMDGAAGQKIVTDVTADVQTVVAVFSKKSDDPCGVALESTLVARDYTTGNSVLESTGGEIVPAVTDIGAVAGVRLIQVQGGGTGSVSSGDVRVQVTTMKGQVFSFGVKTSSAPNLRHRVSWRLLNRE